LTDTQDEAKVRAILQSLQAVTALPAPSIVAPPTSITSDTKQPVVTRSTNSKPAAAVTILQSIHTIERKSCTILFSSSSSFSMEQVKKLLTSNNEAIPMVSEALRNALRLQPPWKLPPLATIVASGGVARIPIFVPEEMMDLFGTWIKRPIGYYDKLTIFIEADDAKSPVFPAAISIASDATIRFRLDDLPHNGVVAPVMLSTEMKRKQDKFQSYELADPIAKHIKDLTTKTSASNPQYALKTFEEAEWNKTLLFLSYCNDIPEKRPLLNADVCVRAQQLLKDSGYEGAEGKLGEELKRFVESFACAVAHPRGLILWGPPGYLTCYAYLSCRVFDFLYYRVFK
jgi:hypothetical protein